MPEPELWFTCEVVRAGPAEDGTIVIAIRDVGGAFPARWFHPLDQVRREMLAVALTAISTSYRVIVLLTAIEEYSRIKRMYITRE